MQTKLVQRKLARRAHARMVQRQEATEESPDQAAQTGERVTVTRATRLHVAPEPSAPTMIDVKAQTTAAVLSRRDGWLHVRLEPSGPSGYLPESVTAPAGAAQVRTGTARSGARIRATADVTSAIQRELAAETPVTILDEVQGGDVGGERTWYQVRTDDAEHTTGFIHASLVTLASGASTSGSGNGQQPSPSTEGERKTVQRSARLRREASSQSELLMDVPEGTVVYKRGEASGEQPSGFTSALWYQVHINVADMPPAAATAHPEGLDGYIHAELVDPPAAATTGGGATSSTWAADDYGYVTYGVNFRAEANETATVLAGLPGGASFKVLNVQAVEGTPAPPPWLNVEILYASTDNGKAPAERLAGRQGWLNAGNAFKGSGPATETKGQTLDQLQALLGADTANNAQWGSPNPLVPTYGGPDFFGPGRYGGQCTWFVNAMRPGLPTGSAGDAGWQAAKVEVTESRLPQAGDVLVKDGHVAYITAVSGAAPTWTLTVSEANWGSPGEVTAGRTVAFTPSTDGSWIV